MTAGSLEPAEPATPRQVPIGDAARAPIGGGTPSRTNKTLDTLAVVVAPLLIPAFVLALVRTSNEYPFSSSFTLGDVAFGIVAVAFAALARAVTGKGEGWKIVVAAAAFAVVFETAIATTRDSVAYQDKLDEDVGRCSHGCSISALQELATRITEKNPVLLHWLVAVFAGALLCSVALYTIWNEK